jgi:hypothetical protein
MHTGSGGLTAEEKHNTGRPLAAMLASLHGSPEWPEIAGHHRLADVDAMRRALDEPGETPAAGGELLEAAVRWSFDPDRLPAATVAQLQPLVAQPAADRWVLPAGSRMAAVRSAGSLDALRAARGDERVPGPGQAVIDRILAGPPYSLDEVEESALPYWLQATRWFADVEPALPSPEEVSRALARRRVRSRLEQIGGAGFRGRAEELAELRAWHADGAAGPMVVTGIGGVGKSALVARFALELPAQTLQLWLDFDRADVAPDDPESVLRLLFEQMATQLDGFSAPTLDATTWPDAVARLGEALPPRLRGAPPPLLVLDGFEVAQHALEHREIWSLLEQLLPALPGVRILVSGRAPVGELVLGGRPAQGLHLEGLALPDAVGWLLEHGFEREAVAQRVAEITNGVPLGLRLAARWRAAGGDVEELPDDAPQWYIDGFLYDRILDRVMDPELKPLATDALVLRRVTPDMIPRVLADSAPPGDPAEVFARLAREMALVGDGTEGHGIDALGVALPGTGVLRLRPEVRSATLKLLATDNAARVRTIDERAVAWYAAQDPGDVANAAEHVYHRLRLGDVAGAEQAWRDGCAPLLRYAEEEVPDGEPRAWLLARTGAPEGGAAELATWEEEARDRVQALLQRGVLQPILPVLEERAERSDGSPLLLYDALLLRWNGDADGARALLDGAPAAEGTVARDRALAAAWLAAEADDRERADGLLEGLDRPEAWSDRPDAMLDALTVAAARVRLRIDVGAEMALYERLPDDPAPELHELLPPADIVSPRLAAKLDPHPGRESRGELVPIPRDPEGRHELTHALDRIRRNAARSSWLLAGEPIARAAEWDAPPRSATADDAPPAATQLERLAWQRWRYATAESFLADATDLALRAEPGSDPQVHAVTGTLAAFATQRPGGLMLVHDKIGPLAELFAKLLEGERQVILLGSGPPPPPGRYLIALRLVRPGDREEPWNMKSTRSTAAAMRGLTPPERVLVYHLLCPDPLEILVRRVAGAPDRLDT